ncbi:MAG: hypothetical protein HKN97_10175 [Myxococcales bacterium]|nr:hypothetical protein [Myxococcales bacterium]
MASVKSGSGDSSFPSVLGDDGAIDLVADSEAQDIHERPTRRISGDAWVADRGRRSLAPTAPPPARPEAPEAGEASPDVLHAEIADCFALGDYARSLSAAELLLGLDPEDENAKQYAVNSRARLETRYINRIGSLDYVFNLAVPAAKVKWLGLDPQAAFLLSLVDGQTTVADVLEICDIGRLEALRVFTELLDAKAIARVA